MVVADADRQDETRNKRPAVPYRFGSGACRPENGDLRSIHDLRKLRAADAADRRNGERAALHVGETQFPVARLLGELRALRGDGDQAFVGGVLEYGYDEPARRVRGETDIVVVLSHEFVAVEAAVEVGELAERINAGFDEEREHRELRSAALCRFAVDLVAEGFEIGDVGLVVIRDMRNRKPIAVKVRAGELLDARERDAFDRAELREVDLRPGREAAESRR